MADPCLLTPPAGATRAQLEAHLRTLRKMDANDPLVALAIEDTERLIAERTAGRDSPSC